MSLQSPLNVRWPTFYCRCEKKYSKDSFQQFSFCITKPRFRQLLGLSFAFISTVSGPPLGYGILSISQVGKQ